MSADSDAASLQCFILRFAAGWLAFGVWLPVYVIPSRFGGEAPAELMRILQAHFDRADRCDYGEYNAILQLDYEPPGAVIEFQATPETIRKDLSELERELYAAGYYLHVVDVERDGGDRPAYDGDGFVIRAIPDRESIPDGSVFLLRMRTGGAGQAS